MTSTASNTFIEEENPEETVLSNANRATTKQITMLGTGPGPIDMAARLGFDLNYNDFSVTILIASYLMDWLNKFFFFSERYQEKRRVQGTAHEHFTQTKDTSCHSKSSY